MTATTIKGKDVVGLRVLSMQDGKQIETVDDIIYDPAEQKVMALIVASGGLFSKAKAIAIEDVLSIGKDAVMVNDEHAIVPVSDLPERAHKIAESKDTLVKTRVVTQEGTELGQVTDIMFNSMTGAVEELEVSQGGVKNFSSGKKSIKPEDIITVGSDATIVKAYTEMAFEAQAEEGGAKGLLNKTKEKVAEVSSVVGEKAQVATEKVKALPDNPKVQDTFATVKEKTVTAVDATMEKAGEVKDQTQQKYEDVKNDPANQERLDTFKEKAGDMRDTAVTKAQDMKPQSEPQPQGAPPIPTVGMVQPETNVVHTVTLDKPETVTIITPLAE